MDATLLSFLAACSAALTNLCLRKSSDSKGSVYRFLFYFYLVSLLFTAVFYSDTLIHFWHPNALAIGCGVGLLHLILMLITSQALQRGPSGLTFIFQNASCVFPHPILVLLFGIAMGFEITGIQIVGMGLVLLGLAAGAFINKEQSTLISKGWIQFAFALFFVQLLIYTLLEGRCLFYKCGEKAEAWFMIGFFGTALLAESYLFFTCKGRSQKYEVVYGILGGLTSGITLYLLLLATIIALPLEAGLIFPIFAVLTLILSNLWGWLLYQERLNYPAILLCSAGILIAHIKA